MQLDPYLEFATKVRRNENPNSQDIEAIVSGLHKLTAAQCGAFLGFSLRRNSPDQNGLLKKFVESQEKLESFPDVEKYSRTPAGLELVEALFGVNSWNAFAQQVSDLTAPDAQLGYFLAAVTLEGLGAADTAALTMALKSSGRIYDYRKHFPQDRLLRRYPTGAVSEKLALIMPVIIAAIRQSLALPVLSPFIVARAFGHTGGTWDKLKAIPGFTLPAAGDESIATLVRCGTCYTVTKGDLNPADDRLYQLRNETNTIESDPLIISSIASKMLACPVELMQLDVRYGSGAFFPNRAHADRMGRKISQICTSDGVKCFHTLTEAEEPGGSSVGRAVEVIEAIEALGGGTPSFDRRGISIQRQIAANFMARLVSDLGLGTLDSIFDWITDGYSQRRFGDAFISVLLAHGVEEAAAKALWERPRSLLDGYKVKELKALKSGRVISMDQWLIGNTINRQAEHLSFELKCRLSDSVTQGQTIGLLYYQKGLDLEDQFLLSAIEVSEF